MKISIKSLSFLVISFYVLSSVASASNLLRNIEHGNISGANAKYETIKFLGIPYASAPVGALRWKAPRDPAAWTGILKTTEMKSACLQKGNFFANVPSSQFGKVVGSEDCLYLNIWTKNQESTVKKPVVLWIHGGSNFKGTSKDSMYDGAYIAAHDDVVFVSINYRLGLLGAFVNDAVDSTGTKADRSGNYTTLDLIQGLKWIRNNINQFGGDFNNVTIMGQSAGCMNVWGLLQSPLAKDLFHKAVCSAGMPNVYPAIVANQRSSSFVNNLVVLAGLAKDVSDASIFINNQNKAWIRDFLYSRTAEDLIKSQDFIVPFQHIQDGYVFPHGLEGVAVGVYNKVPLIIGATDNEGSYLAGASMLKPNEVELWDMIHNPAKYPNLTFGDLVDASYLVYKATILAVSEGLQLTIFNMFQTLRLYQSQNVYRYVFAWNETPAPWNEVFGAVHGMDALFYLGNFVTEEQSFSRFAWVPENKESRERLRAEMGQYFKGFFWTGNPNSYLTPTTKPWKGTITFK